MKFGHGDLLLNVWVTVFTGRGGNDAPATVSMVAVVETVVKDSRSEK
jgi:hypothetical protein